MLVKQILLPPPESNNTETPREDPLIFENMKIDFESGAISFGFLRENSFSVVDTKSGGEFGSDVGIGV